MSVFLWSGGVYQTVAQFKALPPARHCASQSVVVVLPPKQPRPVQIGDGPLDPALQPAQPGL
jgi:hypothetical protein